MKKRYIICLVSVALLAGCGSESVHTNASYESLSGLLIESNSNSDTLSYNGSGEEADGSRSESAKVNFENISSSSVIGDVSNEDALSADSQYSGYTNGYSESDNAQGTESAVTDAREYVLSHDPQNFRVLKIDKDTLTISGKAGTNGFSGIAVDADYRNPLPCEYSDGEFSCTVSSGGYSSGYHTIKIIDSNKKYNGYRIFVGSDGFRLPVSPEVEESNGEVFSAPKQLSDEETARYIAIDGDRKKCSEILGRIKEISDEICGGIDSDYDKLRAISQWVSYEIYYDYPAHDSGIPDECLTLEYMLENYTSVCGGYSNMTSALCAAQGIECYNVKGRAVNNGHCFSEPIEDAYHEWNYAVIDGRGIIVDSGWNSASYYHGGDDYRRSSTVCRWFDIDPTIFAMDHKALSMEYRNYDALAEVNL